MNLFSLLDKMIVIARRDLLIAIRYHAGFFMLAAGAIVELLAFYYLSRAIGPGFRPEGIDYFPFVLVGTGFYTFLVMGVNAFLTSVRDAQQAGTLEVLMTTSTPPAVLLLLSAMSAVAGKAMNLLFYLGLGFMLFGVPFHPNFPGCAVIFLFSLSIAVALGILAAALQLAMQKGSTIIWLLSSGVWLLTGTMFPAASLPRYLRMVSDLIPVTHSLQGMRLALLQGAPFSVLSRDIWLLAIFSLILLPFSMLVFSYTIRRARLQGTFSFY
jgi:ABC-2 type transport system permease protein